MSREKELDKLRKEELVAMLDDLAEQLEEEIPVTGNKDEVIARIIEAESRLAADAAKAGQADTGTDLLTNDEEDHPDDDETADPEQGHIRIRALTTFETLVNGQKVLVCTGESVSLPEAVAMDAVDEALAETF